MTDLEEIPEDSDYQRIMYEAGPPSTENTTMKYMDKYRYKDVLTVTASSYNTKVSIEIPSDSTLNELLDVFKSIAISIGYTEGSWNDTIAMEYDVNRMNEESADRLAALKKSFTHESDC